jgi:uncharacterized membrane protein
MSHINKWYLYTVNTAIIIIIIIIIIVVVVVVVVGSESFNSVRHLSPLSREIQPE